MTAEQEAERRYPYSLFQSWMADNARATFVAGAAFERERLRELLEAAEAYREAEDAHSKSMTPFTRIRWTESKSRLLAAAAALPGESNGRS